MSQAIEASAPWIFGILAVLAVAIILADIAMKLWPAKDKESYE